MCMDWGLGINSAGNKANMTWAKDPSLPSIHQRILHALEIIASTTPDTSRFDSDLRMNAGYTKVYALACPQSLMYDGRVGAALGWLVRKYCLSMTLKTVPSEIAFRWGKAKGSRPGHGPNRNPSLNDLRFLPLTNIGSIHAEWNIKANWIVASAITQSKAEWCSGTDGLRKVESALFMIGYDL